ncbi:hypothetical protein [Pseudobdellovibrio sp. HCB154]|uniref:hypothetical protein n=1 Tax=Pseudobdellovibrio sp. HCB154 TaxID=3386277 RepID=UPI003916FFDF
MQKYSFTNLVFVFVGLGAFFMVGCVGTQEKPQAGDIQYVASKALIEDKTKNSSNSASIDLFYLQDDVIRMEVTALLGYRLGSLVMNSQKVSYALHPQKAFVEGPFAARTMKPLFRQDLDPKLIWAVVFDRDLRAFGFTCSDVVSRTNTCQGGGATQGVTVTVQQMGETPNSGLKKITIENANLKFVWLYKAIRKHNKSYNETFVLNKPEEYRLITIK